MGKSWFYITLISEEHPEITTDFDVEIEKTDSLKSFVNDTDSFETLTDCKSNIEKSIKNTDNSDIIIDELTEVTIVV